MKLNHLLLLFLLGFHQFLIGQFNVPYFNSFDNLNDTIGWSHHAAWGSDDWEVGQPDGNVFLSSYSPPNAWVTNLDGNHSPNSNRVLMTPYFDLSDTSIHYRLGFHHRKDMSSYDANCYLEFSVGQNNSWSLLNDLNMERKNWQGPDGFPILSSSFFKESAIALKSIQGQDSVRFRFRFVNSNSASDEGWIIDDFSIEEEFYNIKAMKTDTIEISQKCSELEVSSYLIFENPYTQSVYNTTEYFISSDTILDVSDTLLGTKSDVIYNSVSNWSTTLLNPGNLNTGYHYLFYKHDANDTLIENIENDNISFRVLKIDSTYNAPYTEDFEGNDQTWTRTEGPQGEYIWELGEGYRHHLDGTHSGQNAWHTSYSIIDYAPGNSNACFFVDSKSINLTSDTGNIVFNFWYKNHLKAGNEYKLQYSTNCGEYYEDLFIISECRNDDWDYSNFDLSTLSSNDNVQFRVTYSTNYQKPEGIMFDDVYVGSARPDLSIERNKKNRFTSVSQTEDTLKYLLVNSGLISTPQTHTSFYWSNDSIFDTSDVFLGANLEQNLGDTSEVWSSFIYTKPTANTGKYYIFYFLDTSEVINEMREYNNSGYFTVYQENIQQYPYLNDFESQIIGWRHDASLGVDDWQWGVPAGNVLDTAFSGSRTWITNSADSVSPMSRMHLYTPIFDLSGSNNPVLEFNMKLHSDYGGQGNANMNMSYSIDGGATWTVLDKTNQSYNRWYYPMEYDDFAGVDEENSNHSTLLFDLMEKSFATVEQYNGRDTKRNTRYILDIGFLNEAEQVQFRFNLTSLKNNSSSPNDAPYEGAMIDDFSLKESFIDLVVDYNKSLMISSVSEKVHFSMNIKNQGNYISGTNRVKFYLSSDTILDGADDYIGDYDLPPIRPDMYHYLNTAFIAPNNLSDYEYLIYELDEANMVSESNEINNIGFWELALDSINSYPYLNDFNDSIVDGWYQYSIGPYGSQLGNFRIRNMLAPSERIYQSARQSGEMFTDRMSSTMSQAPYFYLESPAFNFNNVDSIFLSFDLMCTGQDAIYDRDGGNFQFSTDGGQTWTILTSSFGQSHNWFNNPLLTNLDNEPGWNGSSPGYGIASLDSTSFDISFLKGEENVVFRFKYKSNYDAYGSGYGAQGLRVDNFLVEGYEVDYVANDSMVQINPSIVSPNFNLDYSITNSGQIDGDTTITRFYWSTDNIFDSNDSLIYQTGETPIAAGSTVSDVLTLNYPGTLNQTSYYIFYVTDSDSVLVERSELNNVGSYKVNFILINYNANIHMDTIYASLSQTDFNLTYSIVNDDLSDGYNSATNFYWSEDSIFDSNDQVIHTVIESPILSNDSIVSNIDVTYPLPVNQYTYYLLYSSDDNNVVDETNESDNVGIFTVIFDSITTDINELSTGISNIYSYDNYLYINSISSEDNGNSKLKMINNLGQEVYSFLGKLDYGLNKFKLPKNLSRGIYYIYLKRGNHMIKAKVHLQ